MNEDLRNDLIAHKILTSKEMLIEIQSHIDKGFYNTAMNRMYYACFYAAAALLIKIGIQEVKKHATVRNLFNLHFIKTEQIDKKWGAFYTDIMDCRAAADYEEFKRFTFEEASTMYPHTCEFIGVIEQKLKEIS